jgi:nitronate monooxygenase
MDLVGRMQELLEAERAGVSCLEQMAFYATDKARNVLFTRFRNDEGRFCGGLHRLLLVRDATPTAAVGSFAEKVMALPTEDERIALLIKGQAWVVRKIDEIPREEMNEEEQKFFVGMRETHVLNIEECRKFLP